MYGISLRLVRMKTQKNNNFEAIKQLTQQGDKENFIFKKVLRNNKTELCQMTDLSKHTMSRLTTIGR